MAKRGMISKEVEIAESFTAFTEGLKQRDIGSLVTERQQLRTYIDGETARLSEFLKSYREQMQKLDAEITAMMTQQKITSMKTDTGTAILSHIDSMSIIPEERDAYIDWCLDNWQEYGGEMLQISSPKVAAVRAYMESHEGHLPPHVKKETTVQFSIRKA